MKLSWLPVIVTFCVSIFICLASAQEETHLFDICSTAGNYTSSSIYQKNLNTLLLSLVSNNEIDYGFYNFVEGQGADRVNAIALCRGDISEAACRKCVNFSTTDLPARCPSQKEAVVWYDNCMLRYSNKSIFHSLEGPAYYMWHVNNVSDVTSFNKVLNGLLSGLRDRASSGHSRVKFAIGNTAYANFTRIYALVQCTPDLTQVQCSNCLGRSFRDITSASLGKQGGRVIGPSCNIRYQIDQFYEIPSPASSPAPPPSATASSQPTANIVPPTGGGGSNKVRTTVIIVVSTVCFVILIICMFCWNKTAIRRALR